MGHRHWFITWAQYCSHYDPSPLKGNGEIHHGTWPWMFWCFRGCLTSMLYRLCLAWIVPGEWVYVVSIPGKCSGLRSKWASGFSSSDGSKLQGNSRQCGIIWGSGSHTALSFFLILFIPQSCASLVRSWSLIFSSLKWCGWDEWSLYFQISVMVKSSCYCYC